jgi:hypothetical protein
VATRSKVKLCGRWSTEIVGSSPAEGTNVFSAVTVVCCRLGVAASDRSLVQRVLLIVVCSYMSPRSLANEEAMARVGSHRQKGKKYTIYECESGRRPVP